MPQWPFFPMVVACLTMSAAPQAAAACPDLFPKVHCMERLDSSAVRIVLGADNQANFTEAPVINTFDPNLFVPPSTIPPGYTAGLADIRVDPTTIPTLRWFLGCQILEIDTTYIPDSLVCSLKAGPSGPQGTPGPQGPPGPSNLSTCRTIVAESSTPTATASCLNTERVLVGGGSCANPSRRSASFLRGSYPPTVRSWRAECTSGRATAHAICCVE